MPLHSLTTVMISTRTLQSSPDEEIPQEPLFDNSITGTSYFPVRPNTAPKVRKKSLASILMLAVRMYSSSIA